MNAYTVRLVITLAWINFFGYYNPASPGVVEAITERLSEDRDTRRRKNTKRRPEGKTHQRYLDERTQHTMDYRKRTAWDLHRWQRADEDDYTFRRWRTTSASVSDMEDYTLWQSQLDVELKDQKRIADRLAHRYGCAIENAAEEVLFYRAEMFYDGRNYPQILVDQDYLSEVLKAFDWIEVTASYANAITS